MYLLWASFAEMSFKEFCFSHTQLCIFKGVRKSENMFIVNIDDITGRKTLETVFCFLQQQVRLPVLSLFLPLSMLDTSPAARTLCPFYSLCPDPIDNL